MGGYREFIVLTAWNSWVTIFYSSKTEEKKCKYVKAIPGPCCIFGIIMVSVHPSFLCDH